MKRVLQGSVSRLEGLAGEIRSLTVENKEQAAVRFRERIAALSAEAGVDPVRVHQEAAILLDRLDITEECDRLASHLTAVDALFRFPGDAVGKRFDFLVQEIFRELNTAGNKSAHAGVSALVVLETERESPSTRERSARQIVVFPEPEGADITKMSPRVT